MQATVGERCLFSDWAMSISPFSESLFGDARLAGISFIRIQVQRSRLRRTENTVRARESCDRRIFTLRSSHSGWSRQLKINHSSLELRPAERSTGRCPSWQQSFIGGGDRGHALRGKNNNFLWLWSPEWMVACGLLLEWSSASWSTLSMGTHPRSLLLSLMTCRQPTPGSIPSPSPR
jgi:hypothetical protein